MAKGKRVRGRHALQECRPESLVSTFGYSPQLSEGALVPPIFLSSTFVFRTAEDGERAFRAAYHLKGPKPRTPSLIYTRLNNPNLEILEDRLVLFEPGAERCAVFSSGMAAITTSILSLLEKGGVVTYSTPVYGGTDFLFNHFLPKFGIRTVPFRAGSDAAQILALLEREVGPAGGDAMIFLETPANPTCVLTDIGAARSAIDRFSRGRKHTVYLGVDNTFLGPMWQHPAQLGADLVIYSATKFIGGHSDVLAGAVLGSRKIIEDRIKVGRTIFGTIPSPFDGYLLLRSLDTLQMRMTAQLKSAESVARWLSRQDEVAEVLYPGLLPKGTLQRKIYDRQCLQPGSMISFYLKGGKPAAFRFLNHLRLAKLAVSLGSTTTLAEHPASMTHSDLDPTERNELGIDDRMVRLSIGTEHCLDIIADLKQALRQT